MQARRGECRESSEGWRGGGERERERERKRKRGEPDPKVSSSMYKTGFVAPSNLL
jgi:hypothetical protein